jgi:hypothetical protein
MREDHAVPMLGSGFAVMSTACSAAVSMVYQSVTDEMTHKRIAPS